MLPTHTVLLEQPEVRCRTDLTLLLEKPRIWSDPGYILLTEDIGVSNRHTPGITSAMTRLHHMTEGHIISARRLQRM